MKIFTERSAAICLSAILAAVVLFFFGAIAWRDHQNHELYQKGPWTEAEVVQLTGQDHRIYYGKVHYTRATPAGEKDCFAAMTVGKGFVLYEPREKIRIAYGDGTCDDVAGPFD